MNGTSLYICALRSATVAWFGDELQNLNVRGREIRGSLDSSARTPRRPVSSINGIACAAHAGGANNLNFAAVSSRSVSTSSPRWRT